MCILFMLDILNVLVTVFSMFPVIDTAILIFDIAHIYSNAGQAIRLLLGFTR
jgi:hypothetical protein